MATHEKKTAQNIYEKIQLSVVAIFLLSFMLLVTSCTKPCTQTSPKKPKVQSKKSIHAPKPPEQELKKDFASIPTKSVQKQIISKEKATLPTESNALVNIESESDFKTQIINSKETALVDFYADWCGPCRMLAPTIEKLAAEYSGKAIVAKVNIEKHSGFSSQYNIQSIPCVILFKDGKEVDRVVGLRDKDDYKTALDKVLK
jgi:thioredoxin 1